MEKVRRERLIRQGFAYLNGLEHAGVGTSLAEREELADIAITQNISMWKALEVFLERRKA